MVVNGAGASALACTALIKAIGVPHENVIVCDRSGPITPERDNVDQWKSAHAVETAATSLEEALEGADIFLGLSAAGALKPEWVAHMADKPIIFAMANPDPEITPEEAREVRDDAIFATGRSDYPNQINNVLGFPYIFRGALDVRASEINDEMKIAAAEALAKLAREDVPDEVAAAYSQQRLQYGSDYIIPKPFDPRLITAIPMAVAKAAMDSGVAHKPITDKDAYCTVLRSRLDPTAGHMQLIYDQLLANPKRMVFAEGEEEKVIRAALQWTANGFGTPVLIGREEEIKETMLRMGLRGAEGLEIHNARLSQHNVRYTDFLYGRLQRQGFLYRDCQRLVNLDRNVFAACMVACGDADAMVTGLTRSYYVSLRQITRVLDSKPDELIFGLSMMFARNRTVFIADSTVHELPSPEELAQIAIQTAAKARQMGQEPRVALLSYSTFGNPPWEKADRVREAVAVLDKMNVDFEYDGEVAADVALDPELMAMYPFCRLSGPANVLIMPALHSAHISTKLLQKLGGGMLVGPLLMGMEKPAQVMPMGATAAEVVSLAALTAHEAIKPAPRPAAKAAAE